MTKNEKKMKTQQRKCFLFLFVFCAILQKTDFFVLFEKVFTVYTSEPRKSEPN